MNDFEDHRASVPPHFPYYDHPADYGEAYLHMPVKIDFTWVDSPTPLDPYAAYTEENEAYVDATLVKLTERFETAATAIELPETWLIKALHEVSAALDMRASHNDKSFLLLKQALAKQLPKTPDTVMQDIIQNARAGRADLPQLVRLIKEYPGMISVEVFKSHVVFDPSEHAKSLARLKNMLFNLQQTFGDAQVTIFPESQEVPVSKRFMTPHDAVVWKTCAGTIGSHDSATEIIIKRSALLVPGDTPLNSKALKNNSEPYYALPLSISCYLRAADYKRRAGYTPPNQEVRRPVIDTAIAKQLGERAPWAAEHANDMSPDGAATYLQHLLKASQSQQY
ncbi:MAG: hypothetical protein WAQ25_03160 [Candidatus Saccharimonas sp.]